MTSLLTVASAGCALGAVGLGARWTSRRVDPLGRPRAFPVWSCLVLVIAAGALLYPGVQRHLEESRLARAAAELVGHPVTVHCQTTAGALVDAGSELGYVPYDKDGVPLHTTTVKRDPCRLLRSYLSGHRANPSEDMTIAVHVLTHEAMHMRGETSEAKAECEAVQRDESTAVLLGATALQARDLARAYWTGVYPRMPDDYRSADCAPGGAMDEQLPTAPWLSTAGP